MRIRFTLVGFASLAACTILAGCANGPQTNPHPKWVASIRIVSPPSQESPLPNLLLTIRNTGKEPMRLPTFRGEFFGNVNVLCGDAILELRHQNLWKPFLSSVIIEDLRNVSPGQAVDYRLDVSKVFQSLKDIGRMEAAELKGKQVLVNSDTTDKLRACQEYRLYCSVDRTSITSNIVVVRLR